MIDPNDEIKKPIIIFGSSRSDGDTYKAVSLIVEKPFQAKFLDLTNYNISDFDYHDKNKDDDFINLIQQALLHKTIILATPIYWYTMSALMKRFVDRISGLLSTHKELGRLLRNKNLAVITSYSVYPEGKNGFEEIFINTSTYLGMNYIGCYFHYSGDDEKIVEKNFLLREEFINRLEQANC